MDILVLLHVWLGERMFLFADPESRGQYVIPCRVPTKRQPTGVSLQDGFDGENN